MRLRNFSERALLLQLGDRKYSVSGRRSLANRAEVPAYDLRLPIGVKRYAEDRFALFAQELQNWQCARSSIAGSQCFDQNVGSSLALRTLANHGRFLLYTKRDHAPEFA